MITRSQLKHDAWEARCEPHVTPAFDGFRIGWKRRDGGYRFAHDESGRSLIFSNRDAAREFAREAERLTAQAIARAL